MVAPTPNECFGKNHGQICCCCNNERSPGQADCERTASHNEECVALYAAFEHSLGTHANEKSVCDFLNFSILLQSCKLIEIERTFVNLESI